MDIPVSVWKMFTGLAILLSTASTAAFIIGWMQMEKQTFTKFDYSMITFGTLLLISGLLIFTGTVSVSFLSSRQIGLYGFWAAPLGGMLLIIGLLRPCNFEVEMP